MGFPNEPLDYLNGLTDGREHRLRHRGVVKPPPRCQHDRQFIDRLPIDTPRMRLDIRQSLSIDAVDIDP